MEKISEDDYVSLEVTVKGKKILVTKQIIREVLQIDDQQSFPMEISMDQTETIIEQMGYKGCFLLLSKGFCHHTGDS